jgi:hypothetical protein
MMWDLDLGLECLGGPHDGERIGVRDKYPPGYVIDTKLRRLCTHRGTGDFCKCPAGGFVLIHADQLALDESYRDENSRW